MSRKVFISFLGTSNYTECNYQLEESPDTKVHNVKYIQEALLRFHQSDWSDDDICYFFLTDEARIRNWEDDHQFNFETKTYDKPNTGLRTCLRKMNNSGILKAKFEAVDIPQGFGTEEIWTIFQRIVEKIQKGDSIFLDITHAFRSLPMLGMVLLNYLKALYDVSIVAIYYGAFEKLGTAQNVREMPLSQRNAPVMNLVSLASLQEWTNAAYDFTAYGKVNKFVSLAEKEIKPIFRDKSQDKDTARNISKFVRSLQAISSSIATNRGQTIVEGDIFLKLDKNLSNISEGVFIKPMSPIIDKVREKLEGFSRESDWRNGLQAVQWCIGHDMIQQGITLLQETIITYYCIQASLNYQDRSSRELIGASFYIKGRKLDDHPSKWNEVASLNPHKTKFILSILNQIVVDDYQRLSQKARNDINHGGFTNTSTPESLKASLLKSYSIFYNSLKTNKEP